MNTSEILTHINAEIGRLQQVKALLTGEQSKPKPGRPTKSAKKKPATKKRTLSPEARARIAAGQKARWAKAKEAA
jgi:hypothetical protein